MSKKSLNLILILLKYLLILCVFFLNKINYFFSFLKISNIFLSLYLFNLFCNLIESLQVFIIKLNNSSFNNINCIFIDNSL